MAEKITFQTNILQELALAYPEGKEVQSNFAPDGKQTMFTLVDGRVMFLNASVAQRVQALNLQAREPFEIGRMEKVEGNRKRVEWHIAKVGFAPGEGAPASQASAPAQSNGHHQHVAPTNGITAPANGYTNGNGRNGHSNGNGNNGDHPAPQSNALAHTGWAGYLRDQTNMLIDVFASCSAYASQTYGNAVKAEDVRSLMLSAFINITKGGQK